LESGDSETAQSHGIEGQSASIHSSGDVGPPFKSIASPRQPAGSAGKSKPADIAVGYVPSTSRSSLRSGSINPTTAQPAHQNYPRSAKLAIPDEEDYFDEEDDFEEDFSSRKKPDKAKKSSESLAPLKAEAVTSVAQSIPRPHTAPREEKVSPEEAERRKSLAMIMQRWSMNTIEEFEAAQTGATPSNQPSGFPTSTPSPALPSPNEMEVPAPELTSEPAQNEGLVPKLPVAFLPVADPEVILTNNEDDDDDVRYAESFEEASMVHEIEHNGYREEYDRVSPNNASDNDNVRSCMTRFLALCG
jgi:hypothetical protein